MTMNNVKTLIQNIVELIEESDPQLVNFIDVVFTLIDGADSSDPAKKLSLKQIQQGLWKLPILAMRSPIVLGLYAKYNQEITGTVTFPVPDTVIYEAVEPIGEPNDTLLPCDYQSGAGDDNGDLPSCEMEHNDTPVEFEPEYGTKGDEWTEQDHADFAKDNPDTIVPKATKQKTTVQGTKK